jgi:hypothetical protein
MDTGIQALLVLMAFSTVHERLIELVRRTLLGRSLRRGDRQAATEGLLGAFGLGATARTLVEGATVGPWSALVAIALAAVTRADLLFLFARGADGTQSKFFDAYLQYGYSAWQWDLPTATGVVLMGLSTTLGSKFWHDLAYGLMDLRQSATGLPDTVRKAMEPPADRPPRAGVQAAG